MQLCLLLTPQPILVIPLADTLHILQLSFRQSRPAERYRFRTTNSFVKEPDLQCLFLISFVHTRCRLLRKIRLCAWGGTREEGLVGRSRRGRESRRCRLTSFWHFAEQNFIQSNPWAAQDEHLKFESAPHTMQPWNCRTATSLAPGGGCSPGLRLTTRSTYSLDIVEDRKRAERDGERKREGGEGERARERGMWRRSGYDSSGRCQLALSYH